ncbi:MAG TPA: YihY/virulence factor BrkB family protein [Polyangiales bacterium]
MSIAHVSHAPTGRLRVRSGRHRIDCTQCKMQLQRCLWRAGASWYEDNVMRMSSSLSYYALLSLAPMLVLVVSIAALFWGDDTARTRLARELTARVGPEVGVAVESIILDASAPAETWAGTLVGVLALLIGASGVFSELQDAMNTVWGVKPKPGHLVEGLVRERLASFVMVMATALVLLALLFSGALLTLLADRLSNALPGGVLLWQLIDFALSLGVVVLLFTISFKFLPDVKLRLRDVWQGAVLTAMLFALGELALAVYIRKFAIASPYGAAGSAIVVVVWVYYFFQIMFYGAEYTKVRADALGLEVQPKRYARRLAPKADG